MNNMKMKKLICCLSSILIILTYNEKITSKEENHIIEIEEECDMDYTYENGHIYFCTSELELEKLCETCEETDVIVLDQRINVDPNMKIIKSYKINNQKEMIQILEVIKQYCNNHKSNWNRSIESMYNEWKIHNICSSLSINTKRTNDVDLNNDDEEFYKSKIINKILGN